jgi:hypothetical protein
MATAWPGARGVGCKDRAFAVSCIPPYAVQPQYYSQSLVVLVGLLVLPAGRAVFTITLSSPRFSSVGATGERHKQRCTLAANIFPNNKPCALVRGKPVRDQHTLCADAVAPLQHGACQHLLHPCTSCTHAPVRKRHVHPSDGPAAPCCPILRSLQRF